MPLYEYQCSACKASWDELESVTAPPTITCPTCKTPQAQRLMSPTSFRLKGGGWAKDGYKSPPPR